jgi:hypothetical protein
VKIFLAGVESVLTYINRYPKLIPFLKKCPVFVTFFAKKNAEAVNKILTPHTGIKIVDSGAHSFLSQLLPGSAVKRYAPSQKTSRTTNPKKYFKEYLNWIMDNYENYDYFVELDIQELVGNETVNGWRQLFREMGIASKIIPVWHARANTWKTWCNWVNTWESRYIGIEGPRNNQPYLPYNRFLKYAYDRKCRVHGFAAVAHKLIWNCPFYSVDSIYWKISVMHGKAMFYDSSCHKLVQVSLPKRLVVRKGWTVAETKKLWEENLEHINFITQTDEAKNQSLLQGGIAIQEMAEDYTKIWEGRGVLWEEIMNG